MKLADKLEGMMQQLRIVKPIPQELLGNIMKMLEPFCPELALPEIDMAEILRQYENIRPAEEPMVKKAKPDLANTELTKWMNQIHHGDCLAIMRQLPSNLVPLIVTSPPFNILNSTGGGMRSSGSLWKNPALQAGYGNGCTDDMPYGEYVAWQRACLTEMMRLLTEDGAIFYNHKKRVQGGLLQDRSEIIDGFPVRQEIIWQRAGGFNFNTGYFLPTYETIFLICNKKFRLKGDADHPKAACGVGDVWRINQDSNNPHPAPFPVELAKRCIEATSAEVVLDPFLGSGSTAIACEVLGRHWIGIELNAKYCELAEHRLSELKGPRKEQSS